MKTIILFITLCTGLSGFAADETAAKSGDTPASVCKAMVETAKAKNFDGFMKMTTDMPSNEKPQKMKGNFQKSQGQYLERLQDLNCGNEMVAQDHAMVQAESKGESRLIPFLKTSTGWKFDMKTYQSFYETGKHSHK